jgi:coenzyme F420-reducing hydrogenase alpha subunit
MSVIEGKINIEMHLETASKPIVNISSSRPTQACKIFIGKTPEHVLSVVPLLFNICGVAQSRASLTAIQQCLDIQPLAQHEIARDILLLVENAKEHLLRIGLDWPSLFAIQHNSEQLPYISQLNSIFEKELFDGKAFQLDSTLNNDLSNVSELIDSLDSYLASDIFGSSAATWCKDGSIKSYLDWAQTENNPAALATRYIHDHGWFPQGISHCEQLPSLNASELLKRFNGPNTRSFINSPQWNATCYETTVLSRQLKHPLIASLNDEFGLSLITRWTARLAELSTIPSQLRLLLDALKATSATLKTNPISDGIAQVEAARGLLVHRVEISNGSISQYQILAPTEWNFHTDGVITSCLENLNTDNKDHLEKLAHVVINAIDPCVGYSLRIHHA